MFIETVTPEIQDRAEKIQNQMQEIVYAIIKGAIDKGQKELNYQDAVNTFLYLKLAQLELKIEELIKRNNSPYK